MPVEIDETELANLRGIQAVLQKVETHPEARALAQKAIALAAPERAGPEVKIRSEFDERFAKLTETVTGFIEETKKEREESQTAAARRQLEAKWMEGRAKARAAGYTTDEGLNALEKFMEDRGVADHEVAIAAFEKINPPPAPLMSGSNRWDFFAPANNDQPDLKPLFEGREDDFLGLQIQRALAEVRGG